MEQDIMPNWLKKRAELTPERTALEFQKKTYTFLELQNTSTLYAAALYRRGIREGHTVGLLLGSHADTVFIIHSLWSLGARILLLNTRLTGSEIAFQAADAEASWLISESKHSEVLECLRTDLAACSCILKEDLELNEGQPVPSPAGFSLSSTATIMYTSGTTGRPKGVMQTYGNHWWSAMGSVLNLGLNENDCWLCAVPLFHISGLSILLRSVIYGMRVILHETFDETSVNRDIREKGVTIMSVVSAMLNRIIAGGTEPFPETFRCMLLGGGPAPKALLDRCARLGVPVFQTYGMTETASQFVTLSPEYSLKKLGSAGKPLFPNELYIDVQGRRGLPFEEGEIAVKGPNVTKGYYNLAAETEKAIRGGWLFTGDIGYLDDEGFLYVLDRRSDLIISGGENVYPAEIEAALLQHEHVFEAGAAGMPDEKWGEVPVAFVVPSEGTRISETELLAHCRKMLASYKVPSRIISVAVLPRNASGKLVRRELHRLFHKEGQPGES
ncbi:o-succinylbenzoate--CoA ligase [Peribacillus sp. SCS-37]|uniref:o-succinylbenzoate--CoA ligase n=1 Tax=Paraperibacillus esterisolvens TaxID=3115296 RepID=UPI0039060924